MNALKAGPESWSARTASVGDVFAVPLRKGQFGACRIIGALGQEDFFGWTADTYAVEVIDWISSTLPHLDDVKARPALVLHSDTRLLAGESPRAAVFCLVGGPPATYTFIGHDAGFERGEPLPGGPGSLWGVVASVAYFEQLYLRDRAAYEVEIDEARREDKRLMVSSMKKRGTGVDPAEAERLLEHLEEHESPEVIAAFRRAVREAMEALSALGPRPKAAAVLEVVRRGVEACSDLDEAHGGILDTQGAEELVQAFLDMGAKAGAPMSPDVIDVWRRF